MLSWLGSVTISDMWYSLWRGMVWVAAIRLLAFAMDLEWSWALFWLCAGSDLANHLLHRQDWRS